MARQKFEKSFNTFVKGLMTEASEINFPENYSLYEKNFELRRDGGRDRRRGMDLLYPLGVTLTSLPYVQEVGDQVSAEISFGLAVLKKLVERATTEDAVSAAISFPMATLRLPLYEYATQDAVSAAISFPQATLRAPLTEYATEDAVQVAIAFPQATLRHALIKTEYDEDAVQASISFPEARLYEPD